MPDLLLDLANRPLTKRLVKQFKLPIPLPEPLKRLNQPWSEKPLAHELIAVLGKKTSSLVEILKASLQEEGARISENRESSEPIQAMICDATSFRRTEDLGMLYDMVKPRLASVRTCGRIIILGRAHAACQTPEEQALSAALRGFVKSLAKEIGRRGATCNLLLIGSETMAPSSLIWPLVFFLSPRSAYISGQALTLDGRESAGDTGMSPSWTSAPARTPILCGKTALVTGAARGIGASICQRLAAEGARVIGVDLPSERASIEQLMAEIGGIPFVYDLLAPGTIQNLVHRLETEIGSIDILVHNAGIARDKTLQRMPRDYWDDTVSLNLKAPIELTSSLVLTDTGLIRLMNPGGRVLFISSIGGIAGNVGQTNYAAAKAGLIGYTEALAPKLEPRGITVNAIAPGFIETQMTQKMPLRVREVARRLNALGQAGRPEDIAEAVLFLAAPGAQALTGSVLRVCGLSMIGA